MKILLVAATEAEAAEWISRNNEGRHELHLLLTGIGMVNTAYHLGRYFAQHVPDFAIHVGIAGSFDSQIPLASVVEITSDLFPEMGAEDHDRFLDLKALGFPAFRKPDGSEFYQQFENPAPSSLNFPKVKGITCNTVHGNSSSIAEMVNRHSPVVETMESAAFFQCCLMAGVPFWSFRGISNWVEPRDRSKWKIREAIASVNFALKDALRVL